MTWEKDVDMGATHGDIVDDESLAIFLGRPRKRQEIKDNYLKETYYPFIDNFVDFVTFFVRTLLFDVFGFQSR